MGLSQARILEWVAISRSRGSSQPRDRTCVSYVSCFDRWLPYYTSATGVSPSVSIFSSFYKDTSPIDLSLTWPFHLQRPYFQIRSQSLLPEVRITSSFRRHKSSMIPFTSVSSTPSTGPGKQTEMGSRVSQFQL